MFAEGNGFDLAAGVDRQDPVAAPKDRASWLQSQDQRASPVGSRRGHFGAVSEASDQLLGHSPATLEDNRWVRKESARCQNFATSPHHDYRVKEDPTEWPWWQQRSKWTFLSWLIWKRTTMRPCSIQHDGDHPSHTMTSITLTIIPLIWN